MADLKISQFVDGGAVQVTDEIATNRGGVNTKVLVGSAAALDAGSGVGDLILWGDDGGGNPSYPPADGSQITNINITGLNETVITANTGAAYDIDFSAGQIFSLSVTDDCDLDIINPPVQGGSVPVKLIGDGTPRAITYLVSGLEWANGDIPSVPDTAGDFVWVLFVTDDGGTSWTGFDCGLVQP